MRVLKFVLPLFASLALITTTTAQPGQGGRHPHQGPRNPEMRQAVQEYYQSEVKPVMTEQRAQLDASLSATEQAELEEIRAGLKQLRDETRTQRQAMREQMTPGERPSDTQRAEMRAAHQQFSKQHRQLMTRAWAIADAHEAEIASLLDGLESDAEVWREELKALHEANRPEGAPEGRPERGEGEHRGRRGHHGQEHGPDRARGAGFGKALTPVGFLLWSPDMPMGPQEESAMELSLFPNPTSEVSSLSFDVTQAGLVKVEVLDRQGQVQSVIFSEKVEAGRLSVDVPTSDLEPGIYMVRATMGDQVKATKLIVE